MPTIRKQISIIVEETWGWTRGSLMTSILTIFIFRLLTKVLDTAKFLFRILGYSGFRNRFLILMISWFSVGTVWYGLSFAVKLVEFNTFLVTGTKPFISVICILGIVPLFQKVFLLIHTAIYSHGRKWSLFSHVVRPSFFYFSLFPT